MAPRNISPPLSDIIDAIERISGVLNAVTLKDFESDWQKQWLVERGIEIISEASRRLPDHLKDRYPQIPWRKVAGIGNVLRHNYEHVAAELLWKLAQNDLSILNKACRDELARARAADRP